MTEHVAAAPLTWQDGYEALGLSVTLYGNMLTATKNIDTMLNAQCDERVHNPVLSNGDHAKFNQDLAKADHLCNLFPAPYQVQTDHTLENPSNVMSNIP